LCISISSFTLSFNPNMSFHPNQHSATEKYLMISPIRRAPNVCRDRYPAIYIYIYIIGNERSDGFSDSFRSGNSCSSASPPYRHIRSERVVTLFVNDFNCYRLGGHRLVLPLLFLFSSSLRPISETLFSPDSLISLKPLVFPLQLAQKTSLPR